MILCITNDISVQFLCQEHASCTVRDTLIKLQEHYLYIAYKLEIFFCNSFY